MIITGRADVIDGLVLVVKEVLLRDGALDERAEVNAQLGDFFGVFPALFLELLFVFQLVLTQLFPEEFDLVLVVFCRRLHLRESLFIFGFCLYE